jgi:hypothetical protein
MEVSTTPPAKCVPRNPPILYRYNKVLCYKCSRISFTISIRLRLLHICDDCFDITKKCLVIRWRLITQHRIRRKKNKFLLCLILDHNKIHSIYIKQYLCNYIY